MLNPRKNGNLGTESLRKRASVSASRTEGQPAVFAEEILRNKSESNEEIRLGPMSAGLDASCGEDTTPRLSE